MEQLYDKRLPLSAQARLRMVELEAASLSRDELQECLLAAWSGWMLERHLVNNVLAGHGIQIDTRLRGYTPAEVCH